MHFIHVGIFLEKTMATLKYRSRGRMKLWKWELLVNWPQKLVPRKRCLAKGEPREFMLPVPMYKGTGQCAGSEDTNTLLCSQMSFTPTQLLPFPKICSWLGGVRIQEKKALPLPIACSRSPVCCLPFEGLPENAVANLQDLSNGLSPLYQALVHSQA